jgi:hypothetical protein
MQQMLERILAGREEMKASQAKVEADRQGADLNVSANCGLMSFLPALDLRLTQRSLQSVRSRSSVEVHRRF